MTASQVELRRVVGNVDELDGCEVVVEVVEVDDASPTLLKDVERLGKDAKDDVDVAAVVAGVVVGVVVVAGEASCVASSMGCRVSATP